MVDLTTISVSKETRNRLRRLKPYESMSFDELLNELADEWERGRAEVPADAD